jgi:hypothetical protein
LALKEEIGVLAVAWGVDMAVRHMAETHPDFERAKRRMTDAYGKLFDLEQLLRTCIEKVLTGVHGNDWWNLASIDQDIRRTVNKREGEPGNRWLDDYSTSVLRFTDLDHLRRIVEKNRHHFPAFDGEIDWFKSTMIYLTRPRNRIGHVNTLSEDDFLKFLFSADQVIALIPKDARP